MPSLIPFHLSPRMPKANAYGMASIMEGPYSWRPPTYWFSGKYVPSRGSSVEQGDNEHIPHAGELEEVYSRLTNSGRSTTHGFSTPERFTGASTLTECAAGG